MGVCRFTMILVLTTVLLPSIAMAREYIVGDEKGWSAGVDYQAWAARKIFFVGDILVFKYAAGQDHVYRVNGASFQSCTVPPASFGLSSGNDAILLTIPDRRWYIGDHCNNGQKLVITVFPSDLSPSSLPPSVDPPVLPPRSHDGGWTVPSIPMGRVYIVGDEKGWSAGVDYQAWAARKIFFVGDILVFKYAAGQDHVYRVDGASFQSCTVPPPPFGSSSGNDAILLTIPDRRWYIGDHCNNGQKLVITVFPRDLSPSSLPPSVDPPVLPPRSHYGGWTVPKKLLSVFH